MSGDVRRTLRYLGPVVSVLVLGTVGYRVLDAPSWWDAFYMTVITLTTVGYNEVFPLSRAGETFTVVLLLTGLGILFGVVMDAGRRVIEGEVRQAFGWVRRSRNVERMTGHEIVCGFGRMGHAVVDELRREGRQLVVVERSPEKVVALQEAGISVVQGDAASEETLRSAGVDRARGLVACLNDDAHNVYTVLTARSLNPSLYIVARAGEPGAESRLVRAGASKVVNPYHLGGIRLAQVLVKPAVVDFLDVSFGADGGELVIEQLHLTASTPITGETLAGAELRRRWGVAIVGIKREGRVHPNPPPDFRLEDGDVLIVLGDKQSVGSFERAMSVAA